MLAQQYKSAEALKAFRRMEEMDIKPTGFTYNQLILNFAKNKNLDMVMSLMKEAEEKYSIMPGKYIYNNLLLCYAKLN